MAASGLNTATKTTGEELPEEPSMEEILASIKQIIADDEAPEDGLSERDRYTHPSDHSNSNEVDDAVEADLRAGMEAELAASLETENDAAEVTAAPQSIDVGQAPVAGSASSAPQTLEERAAEIRREITAEAAGLSSDQRLEKYRVRGKLQMETLAETQAAAPVAPQPVAPTPVSPAVAAGPILPTTNAIAQEMAATMMQEKSDEIQTMVAELMRPTIRQWLSDNLPSMVEKLVREEIERVSRGKRAS